LIMKKVGIGLLLGIGLVGDAIGVDFEDIKKDKEFQCVVEAVYHESRGEGREGWVWVSSVILNRVANEKYPNKPCAVVTDSGAFSYRTVLDKEDRTVDNQELFHKIQVSVYMTKLARTDVDLTDGALFFHSTDIQPHWADDRRYITTIGNHKFYK